MAIQGEHADAFGHVGDKLSDITDYEIAYVIDRYVHNERNRAIMKRRLIDGICFEPLADEFNLSVRQTKTIVYKCEQIIFKHLNFL